jgi:hypothetical protein
MLIIPVDRVVDKKRTFEKMEGQRGGGGKVQRVADPLKTPVSNPTIAAFNLPGFMFAITYMNYFLRKHINTFNYTFDCSVFAPKWDVLDQGLLVLLPN